MTRIAWLPGYTMTPAVFAPLWAAMPDYDHLGIALPGQGADAHTTADLDARADAIAEQLVAVGVDVLVGLSYGSCLALHTALRQPTAVPALVLAAPTLAGQPEDPAARAKFMLLYSLRRTGADPATLADVWLADPPAIFTQLRRHPTEFDRVRADIVTHSFAELGTNAMAATRAVRHDAATLSALTSPTLVLSGTEDMPIFAENACRLGELAVVDVETLAGAGHLPLLEEPAHCAGLIDRWLQAVAAPDLMSNSDNS